MIMKEGSIRQSMCLRMTPDSFIWRCNDAENRSRAFFGRPHGCFPQRGTFLDQGQQRGSSNAGRGEGAPRPGSSYPASATRPQIPLQGWTTPSAHHVNRVVFEREQEIVANHIFKGSEDQLRMVLHYSALADGAERK